MKFIIWLDPKNIIHHKVCKILIFFVHFIRLCSIMFKFLMCFQVCRRMLCWQNCSSFTGSNLSHVFHVFSSFTTYSTSEGLVSLYPILHMFLRSLGRLWPILQEELADLAFEVWKHCCRDWLLKERRHGACRKGISVLISLTFPESK